MAKEWKISIIGVGTVGTAIGHILQQKGYQITAIAARTEETLKRAHSFLSAFSTCDVVEAAKAGDLIFITTSDDQIETVCQEVAEGGGFSPGDAVFHMSGALPTDVLKPAQDKGAKVGSIHPMQTFAGIEGAIKNIPGSVFGITANSDLLPVALRVAEALGGEAVEVKDEDKAIYHAAACAVCNYFVTLVHYGEDLYQSLGIPKEVALKAFLPLLKGTLANLERYGTAKALTGPIARGDVGTIKKHLDALKTSLPEKVDLYKLLGRYTVKVALEKGTLTEEKAKALREVLDLPAAGRR